MSGFHFLKSALCHLSDKQIHIFAQKLSQHPEFAAEAESYDQLAASIAVKLSDPAQVK
ncbi:hypothetical protein K6I41_08830 [Acinetobacter sp. AS23]|nr:hypothetical protein K6I41_08830 [Acinetobacter sp. AS23]